MSTSKAAKEPAKEPAKDAAKEPNTGAAKEPATDTAKEAPATDGVAAKKQSYFVPEQEGEYSLGGMPVPPGETDDLDALAMHNMDLAAGAGNIPLVSDAMCLWLRAHPGKTMVDLEKELRRRHMSLGLIADVQRKLKVTDAHAFYSPTAPFEKREWSIIFSMRPEPAILAEQLEYGLTPASNLEQLAQAGVCVSDEAAEAAMDKIAGRVVIIDTPGSRGEIKLSRVTPAELVVQVESSLRKWAEMEAAKKLADPSLPEPKVYSGVVGITRDGCPVTAFFTGAEMRGVITPLVLIEGYNRDGQLCRRAGHISDRSSWRGFIDYSNGEVDAGYDPTASAEEVADAMRAMAEDRAIDEQDEEQNEEGDAKAV
jgi:hypothetical protein